MSTSTSTYTLKKRRAHISSQTGTTRTSSPLILPTKQAATPKVHRLISSSIKQDGGSPASKAGRITSGDYLSEPISGLYPTKSSEKKVCRKIRTMQDFNQLNNNSPIKEPVKSAKADKKTKKLKNRYALPKVFINEDPGRSKENLSPNINLRKRMHKTETDSDNGRDNLTDSNETCSSFELQRNGKTDHALEDDVEFNKNNEDKSTVSHKSADLNEYSTKFKGMLRDDTVPRRTSSRSATTPNKPSEECDTFKRCRVRGRRNKNSTVSLANFEEGNTGKTPARRSRRLKNSKVAFESNSDEQDSPTLLNSSFRSDDVFEQPETTPLKNSSKKFQKSVKFTTPKSVNVSIEENKYYTPLQNSVARDFSPKLISENIRSSFDSQEEEISRSKIKARDSLKLAVAKANKRNITREGSPKKSSAKFIKGTNALNQSEDKNCSLSPIYYLKKLKPKISTGIGSGADPQFSVINLSTPLPKTTREVTAKQKKKLVTTKSPNITRKSFSTDEIIVPEENPGTPHNKSFSFNQGFCTSDEIITLVEEKSDNFSNSSTKTPARLLRSNTFTKHDSRTLNDFLVVDDRKVDTSKVTKRRRWNKTLPNSPFLENTPPPWAALQQSFDVEIARKDVSFADLCTPPSSASTPFPASKKFFKQSPLKNEIISGSKMVSDDVKKSARTKMPNFALIHQRAYDKLENLQEMSKRKAVRAKLLLSGHDPNNVSVEHPESSSKSKKMLQISPKSKDAPLIIVTKVKNISPSQSNPKVLAKKKETLKSRIPRLKPANKVVTEKKGLSKLGFKVEEKGTRNVTREEQIKAVISKTHIVKNSVETRRDIIRGVRSNRRFELLMQMRKK